MALRADYASLRVVDKYNDLPASGAFVGDTVLVGGLAQIAKWDGSVWQMSRVDSGLESKNIAAHQANTSASDVAGLVVDFNALLLKLQNAGLMSLT